MRAMASGDAMQVLVEEGEKQMKDLKAKEAKMRQAREDAMAATKTLDADYTAKFNTQRGKLQVHRALAPSCEH